MRGKVSPMARRGKLHYAWVVAAVTFLTLLVAAGLRSTPGVLIVPLEAEFGWSRATISFAVWVNIFLYGLIGPFAGVAMGMFRPRRSVTAALARLAAVAHGNPVRRALAALRDGLRSRDFWLLAGSFFLCGASTNGLIGTHLIPACLDHGIPPVAGASLLAAMGVFDLVGTTLSGWL